MKRRDLERLTGVLLDPDAWPVVLRDAAIALQAGFCELGRGVFFWHLRRSIGSASANIGQAHDTCPR